MSNQEQGRQGEELAVEFLKQLGYEIRERNFFKRIGEIDIIAFDPVNEEYVFVEVKMRSSNYFGTPEEAVSPQKVNKMAGAAQHWLLSKNLDDLPWRLDVIAIEKTAEGPKFTHLQNISQL